MLHCASMHYLTVGKCRDQTLHLSVCIMHLVSWGKVILRLTMLKCIFAKLAVVSLFAFWICIKSLSFN